MNTGKKGNIAQNEKVSLIQTLLQKLGKYVLVKTSTGN